MNWRKQIEEALNDKIDRADLNFEIGFLKARNQNDLLWIRSELNRLAVDIKDLQRKRKEEKTTSHPKKYRVLMRGSRNPKMIEADSFLDGNYYTTFYLGSEFVCQIRSDEIISIEKEELND